MAAAMVDGFKIVELLELLSSSSSSDDDDFLQRNKRRKIPKIINFIDVIHQFSDLDFKRNFRVSRHTAYQIIEQYENSQFYPSDRSHGGSATISAELDILSFLWFAGNKVCLRDVSQRFGVCPATTFRQNLRVMNFLINIAPNIIKFSNIENTPAEFLQIADFPNVIGCIDGTFIKIRTPSNKIKSTYVNRHDIPAITLQGICDAKKRFVDAFTGIPSKIHDARVLKLSDIYAELPQICGGQYHILGDAAYPIRKWLMVPFRDYGNISAAEREYNKRFCVTRVLIENTFGLLKGRFRQLTEIDLHNVDKISKFIISCCVLHNLCIDNNDEFNIECINHPEADAVPEEAREEQEIILRRLGEIKRTTLTETFI